MKVGAGGGDDVERPLPGGGEESTVAKVSGVLVELLIG